MRSDRPEPALRDATVDDAAAIGAMLGRAFADDPLFRWLLPDDASRAARLARLFTSVGRHLHLPQRASSTFEGCVGAAMWLPPGAASIPLASALRVAPDALAAFGARALVGLRVLSAVERLHPRAPHHYLAVLGVDPAHQGRGLGRRLLAPTLARADAERRVAYLETSKESNVALYRRFGFEVTRELRVGAAPPIWLMTRTPRDPAGA